MDFVNIILDSIFSVLALFLLTKLMGNKQLSQLSMFDYVTGISIGSIAAEMATDLDKNPWHSITAMAVYAFLALILTFLTQKFNGIRKIVSGRPIILFNNGTFYRKNFRRARLDLSEFLSLARCSGYFDLTQLHTAILECNGRISFLPNADSRPATPSDFGLSPEEENIHTDFILDGKILSENLKRSGKNEAWLKKQLQSQGYKSEKEIFLAFTDQKNSLTAYPICEKNRDPDPFE